jgi:predicted DNA-binding transcriptional regulator AlpA
MQTDTAPLSVLIDAAELARMLSVSKPTIWRMRADDKLPSAIALTSQCIRWRRADVESWLSNGCPSGDAQRPEAAK